jgi:hypothetical protein
MFNDFCGIEGWDWLEICSLAAIAIGAVCDLILRGKKLNCSPDENGLIPVSGFFDKEKLESKRHNWETFWEILLILGLLGEIPAALHGIKTSGEMKLFAANIGTTNAQLVASNQANEARIEQLRASNDLLWQHSRPRGDMLFRERVSTGNATNPTEPQIESELKKMPTGKAEILYIENDNEAFIFAINLCAYMNMAGWHGTTTHCAALPARTTNTAL